MPSWILFTQPDGYASPDHGQSLPLHPRPGLVMTCFHYSFIVPSGTMVIHPVRMSGTVIGAKQTYDYFKQMQDRILRFIETHSGAKQKRMEELMMNTDMMSKDLGTILVGEEAVREGLINEVGGIHEAVSKLHKLIDERKN